MREAGKGDESPGYHDSYPLVFEVESDRTVNYAYQQNGVPVIRAIHIANRGLETLDDISLVITSDPPFTREYTAHLSRIHPGTVLNIHSVDLPLNASFLSEQRERVRGSLFIKACIGERVVGMAAVELDVLAYNEWNGLQSLPEILAAFVTPNHPEVEKILHDAGVILGAVSPGRSLSGYQDQDPAHVYLVASAVYTAVQRRSIVYSHAPASFENTGQQIRLPGRIMEARVGNCLDLTCMFAGCLEQAGLHPLVIITDGHAFCGVWLEEESFTDPVVDDLVTLRKRVELHEITVFEPTAVTSTSPVSFDESVRAAESLLANEAHFRVVIDLYRARSGIYRIHPIPVPVSPPPVMDGDESCLPSLLHEGELIPGTIPPIPAHVEESLRERRKERRIDSWKRHLLDLSNKNSLLNFQESRQNLRIIHPDLTALETAFLDGRTFRIFPLPERVMSGIYPDCSEDFTREFLCNEFGQNRLYTPIPEKNLPDRLLHLYQAAQGSINENGTTTLFLALGFLSWYESADSKIPLLSPLFLIPLAIERRSFQEGFTLIQGDEDPRVNITLLHRLKTGFGIEIPGLDPAPGNEVGIDVRTTLLLFRKAIRDIPKWQVLDTAAIGHFSFSKFMMWRDLDTYGEIILGHPLVAGLNDPENEPFRMGGDFSDPRLLDKICKPSDLFLLLSADSSQQNAVMAAGKGLSFVLYGPPGTGKSQTITNIIAHCLGIGKTVLFVSEKRVALDVVHERLKESGLGQFCLELHSNKSSRREVIRQFSTEIPDTGPDTHEHWVKQTGRLFSVRSSLNAYIDAIHTRQNTGESYHDGISRLAALRDSPAIPLALPGWSEIDTDLLAGYRDLVRKMGVAGSQSGHPSNHPWNTTDAGPWSLQYKNSVLSQIETLIHDLDLLIPFFEPVAALTGLDGEDLSRDNLEEGFITLQMLENARFVPPALLAGPDPALGVERFRSVVKMGRDCDARGRWIRERYREDIFTADLFGIGNEAAAIQDAGIFNRWYLLLRFKERVEPLLASGYDPDPGIIAEDVRRIAGFKENLLALQEEITVVEEIFGTMPQSGKPDWDKISTLLDQAATLLDHAGKLSEGESERFHALLSRWSETISVAMAGETTDASLASSEFMELFPLFRSRFSKLTEQIRADPLPSFGDPADRRYLPMVVTSLSRWRDHINELRSWCFWVDIREKAKSMGLAGLVRYYETNPDMQFSPGDIFDRSYYQQWTEHIRDSSEPLRTFLKADFEDSIASFRMLDEICMRVSRDMVVSLLASRLPSGEEKQELAEMAILSHQKQLQRKNLPIRMFLQRIPTILPKIKPCLLMSPISVSQYLEPSLSRFDVVIFDEASQIPIWDAIGVIARGKQTIIVGDPKQLPPAREFQRGDDEEPECGIVNLESILDDSIAAGVAALQLSWHYRSRHESLISFSNYHFYQNRLVTFPSPNKVSAVSLKHIGGTFDRGRTRTNRREAEAVVMEIVRRLRDPVHSSDSLGVVTFNASQQDLILTLLEKSRRESPEIDPFFSDDRREPVFVKNLENVQGDERDLILFSVGYGPDPQGKVSMNFGPLNREGGERRLNVAITRARKEIVVFSSLHADQIDLALTRSEGVRLLKNFLAYARMGPAVVAETCLVGSRGISNGIEEEIAERLRGTGRSIQLHIGCGGFRIDLAVEDPATPGRFLLGIICDGPAFRDFRTARDRFRLQEEVLRGLGWELHRVWCSDWWDDPDKEMERIESVILREIQKCFAESTSLPKIPSDDDEDEGQFIVYDPGEPEEQEETGEPDPCARPYIMYSDSLFRGQKKDFSRDESSSDIISLLSAIVKTEGPVSEEYTMRKLIRYWGIRRLGPAIVERIRSFYGKAGIQARNEGYAVFLWNCDQNPDLFEGFRVRHTCDPEMRSIDGIAPQEIANAVRYCTSDQPGLSDQDLVRAVIRLFGMSRRTIAGETVIKGIIGEIHPPSSDKGEGRPDDQELDGNIPDTVKPVDS